jgi:beta-mannosidase
MWNERDYTAYREWTPRFVSEFGFQGPPSWSTLTRAVPDDPLLPDSPGVLSHQKAADGNGKLARGIASHLPDPRDTDDWHYLTQRNQACAVSFGIEHFRSLDPLCAGTIVWQLNDCWPVTSWAAIDGDGRRKPLWYAVRRGFAHRLLTLQPRFGAPAAVLVNDGDATWVGTLEVTRRTMAGTVLAKTSVPVEVRPGDSATVTVPRDVAKPTDVRGELLVAELQAPVLRTVNDLLSADDSKAARWTS